LLPQISRKGLAYKQPVLAIGRALRTQTEILIPADDSAAHVSAHLFQA
jgi:hypothetical protein